MKLTTARMLDLAATGVSAEAIVLYLAANTWATERGAERLTTANLLALPGAPRNPKHLGRLLLELISAGLLVDGGEGYEVVERLSAAASRMRRWRANRHGTGDGHVRITEASRVTGVLSEQTEHDAGDPPSPPAPPLPDLARSGSGISESSSLLSSGSGPESKRARGAKSDRRWRFVPADWAVKDAHRKLASDLRVNVEHQEILFREHEFAEPKSDADKAFSRWLRRAAEFAPKSGVVPPNPRTAAADAEVDRRAQRELELERARLQRASRMFEGGS